MLKITQLFIKEVPHDIMKGPKGSILMYNTLLNMLYRVTKSVGVDRLKCVTDLEAVFNINDGSEQMN
jgi:hypothetical protein